MEQWQNRMGITLWDHPEQYIENSPIFLANQVRTPILTIANKNDLNVPFAQGIEWFLALRRLGKPCWMLQYDGQDHGLDNKDCYKDYVVRMTQFFDHYLKGKPAPIGLLDGIPASQKGYEMGYQLDSTGRTPGPGLLMKAKR